ncbi:MAG: DUF1684 domain-containing protein [Candidatus Marinimicrobia bacterium]|nr:DUF1684 domain-containing protein [Candidatus Neomarinimicrobiota bacterium]
MRFTLYLMFISLTLSTCISTLPEPVKERSEYEKQVQIWHQNRNDRLNQPNGWLTLAGLFWLEEGDNRFGSAGDNDLVFPGEKVPAFMGVLYLDGENVAISVADNIPILLRDSIITEIDLNKDSDGEPDILTWENLTWYIIQRGERTGVRLRDSQHPNYVNFKPTALFPIDSSWRVPATLETFDTTRSVDIVNVLGDTSPGATPGILHFELNGQGHTLTPLADPGDENYFIIFGDATNGLSTYGAGRFLVIPAVDTSGKTYIDFNKSYNMPCAFSPFATCPLPPPENQLSVAITAGELIYEIEGGH